MIERHALASPHTGSGVRGPTYAALALQMGGSRASRYDRLIEAGSDLFSRHAPDGRFLEASPAALPLLGRSPGGLVGARWQDLAHPADRERLAAWWRAVSERPAAPLTFRALRPDGTVVWLECAASAALGEDRVLEIQAVTRGVTQHLSRTEGLSRRCAELERRAAQLEQANRDLAAFAADAAHDLRAPIQVISGFAELLARREGARLDEASQGFLAHVLTAASGMREVVEAVLEHRQSTSAALAVAPVDCHDLVIAILKQLQSELDEADAHVEVHELPTVPADRVQLGRVFQNLLSNALKATPPGRRPRIVVSARRLPRAWELSVTDNGIGVSPDDRRRIFELFQRGHRGGTGLGLAICRAVVERHGGRIGVERARDGGSRFFFSLPDGTEPVPPPSS